MKKKTFLLPAVLVLLFLGSCSLQKDVSMQQEIDEAALQAEEKSEEVADLLAGTSERLGESIGEQNMIDQAIAESDKEKEDAQELLAESQTGGPADYILGIDGDEAMKCSPGEIDLCLLEYARPDEKYYYPCNECSPKGCPCNEGFENNMPCGENYYPAYLGKQPDNFWDDFSNGEYKKKTNEAYVWGLTKCGSNLFFGTAPNVHCLVLQGYLGFTDTLITDSFVCEGNCEDEITNDWRPPSFYMYSYTSNRCVTREANTKCQEHKPLINLTPSVYSEDKEMLLSTAGIRSAWNKGGVAYLAGPAINRINPKMSEGINVFAFKACSGEYLGGITIGADDKIGGATFDTDKNVLFNNVRKAIEVNGEVYIGVGGEEGGAVLKWTGGLSYKCVVDEEHLFAFEVVGRRMDGLVAELCSHEGRIFVTTWPKLDMKNPAKSMEAGVWMSPPLDSCTDKCVDPCAGLSVEDADDWEKVWSVLDYEPDRVTALAYGGGAIASYEGHVYWGTMHVPLLASLVHFQIFGEPADKRELATALLGTWRAISIFRGKNLDARRWRREIDKRWGKRVDPRYGKVYLDRWNDEFQARIGKRFDPFCVKKIELLYGERFLPVYNPGKGWRLWPNKMAILGQKPEFGHSGFGNLFNNYCWTMAVYNKKLWVGTMDWSYLLFGTLLKDVPHELSFAGYDFSILEKIGIQFPVFGADLYSFEGCCSPAKAVSKNGMNNPMNYGLRTMVSDDALYLGTANPMNLHPDGGWELIRLVSH